MFSTRKRKYVMVDNEIHRTQVDLDGLLEVLSSNLYSTPIVVIRELVQNAHDACVRRQSESDWDGLPTIRISGDISKNTVTITDNGSGLLHKEINDYLATIGSGYTRVLRKSKENENVIGYFGLGFLTAYVVAEKVEFITTSYQSPQQTCRFTSKGGKQYRIATNQAQHDIGSSVVLHLHNEYARLAEAHCLTELISRYCCLLPIDIFVNNSPSPTNNIPIPWRLDTNVSNLRHQRLSLEFAQVFDRNFEPITTITIPYDDEVKLSGLIWIQDGSYYSTMDNRVSTVFIRSMHVSNNVKELLPEWAGFVGCVIDSQVLTPTASRETVRQDHDFENAKALIKKILVNALAKIASERGATWRRLQSRHNQSLIGACLADEHLFSEMHDILELPTSVGDTTASEAIRRTVDGKLTIVKEQGGGFEQLIARGSGIPLVYGYRYGVMAFCEKLNERHAIELRIIGGEDGQSLFPIHNANDELSKALNENFTQLGAKLIVSKFEPTSLPAVYVLDQDALLKQRLASDKLDRSISSAALSLARNFTDSLEVENEAYFYINTNNPLISNFLSYTSLQQALIAKTILVITKLLSHDITPTQEADNTEAMLQTLTESIMGLAEEQK